MRALPCLALTIALVPAAVAAQSQPDFSGHWVLVDPPRPGSDVARALTVQQPITRATARGEPMPPAFLDFTVERELEHGGRFNHYTIGTESGSISGGPGVDETRVSVLWRDDRLFIATRHLSGSTRESATTTDHSEEWSLDHDRLTIVIVDREGQALPTLQTLIYKRSP